MENNLHIVYSKKHFVIYQLSSKSYLVHNTRKDLNASTSIKKLNIAKDILNWALYEKIPNRTLSIYILRGLIRISDSKDYAKKITEIAKNQHLSKSI